MEFLDDLRERKTGKQNPQAPTPSQAQQAEEDDPWESLLTGASFDESQAPDALPKKQGKRVKRQKAKKAKPVREPRKGKRPGLSGGQKLILGVLALVVILIWVVIGTMISGGLLRASPGTGDEPALAVTSLVGLSVVDEPPTPTSAPAELAQENVLPTVTPLPTATPLPTSTPIPIRSVSTVYDARILQDPDNIELYLARGEDYLSLGVYDAAVADYEKAISLDERNASAYVGLGWASYYTFDWEAAEAAFGSAVTFNQDLAEAHFGLGLLYYYQGIYAGAVREFDWAAEIEPTNAAAEAWLGLSAAKLGERQEAVDAVDRAMNITQDLPIIYIARSWVHRIQDPPNLEGAHGDLLYALDIEPNQFMTLNALASFYADHRPDRLSEAEVRAIYARDWAGNEVERAAALQTLGRVYLALGRKADAQRVLTEALDLATTGGTTYLMGLMEDLARSK